VCGIDNILKTVCAGSKRDVETASFTSCPLSVDLHTAISADLPGRDFLEIKMIKTGVPFLPLVA
jgi:hypothetical protein